MRSTIVLMSASLLLVACSQELSDDDTRKAWVATNAALAQGSAQAQVAATSVPAVPGQSQDLRPRVAAQVDYTWNCLGGGTAHFVGDAQVDATSGSSDVSFNLATEFDACAGSGVTISGSLDYAASVSATSGSASTTLTMKGSLSYEGDVEGSCDIDMKASVSASAGSVGASYEGSICGHDASATLNVKG